MPRRRRQPKKKTFKSLLRALPEPGMNYPHTGYLLDQPSRDDSVVTALEKAGFIPTGKGKAATSSTKPVDEALADMFTLGLRPDIKIHLTAQNGGLLEFLSALKKAVPWAQNIGESVFIELCERLVAARMVCRETSTAPWGPNLCSTAMSIDQTYKEIGGLWNIAEFELYEIMGGYEEEDEEDKANKSGSTGMDVEMADAPPTSLEGDVEEENIREGVRQMNLKNRMNPRHYWYRSENV
ncbi:hypothetical protein F4813DRAFT_391806 [Daldinia decipiens]|uniref:uncharacterized protein n=1 Tax=Daldinia decipiens TaxID=326647 RepID=UPI0020C4D99C|nr:uncharacterized protein F4813DRAFT_391806 [Daldinia decipiens]KAI1655383.1 hypothetical protein F4813DRAFT_391806 [Daldinia decipiens]